MIGDGNGGSIPSVRSLYLWYKATISREADKDSSQKTKRPAYRAGKQIHIRLSDEIHRKLRVRCAYEGLSVQEYVARLLTERVGGLRVDAPDLSGAERRKR